MLQDAFLGWGNALADSLWRVWLRCVELLPNLIGALLILIIGVWIAKTVGRLVTKVLHRLYLDNAISKSGVKPGLEKVGFKLSASEALGLLVRWFLYLVFLIAFVEIMHLEQVSVLLQAAVLYVPNVIVAAVILIFGIIISNFVFVVVKEASLAAKLSATDFLATAAKWTVLVFAVMAALVQLAVATELIQILFAGLVFMLALAGGLAFGLGGKDKAKELLDRITKK